MKQRAAESAQAWLLSRPVKREGEEGVLKPQPQPKATPAQN